MPNLKHILARILVISGLFTLFSVLVFVVLKNRIETVSLAPISPWNNIQLAAQSGPQEQIALWSDGNTTLLVWPGSPASPNLNIMDVGRDSAPVRLQLGITPRRVTVYPAPDGGWQILWLDQTLPGEDHLMSALVARVKETYVIERGPTQISDKATADYSGGVTANGDLIAAWTQSSSAGSALFIQRIDGQGRPRQPVPVSASGSFPSVASDTQGNLYLAWLEAGANSLWTIRFTPLTSGETAPPQGLPVGVIQPGDGQVLDSFTMGLDATNVFCLWGTVAVREEAAAQVVGLSFPLADSTDVRSFSVTNAELASLSLRWPDVPARAGQMLTISLTGQAHDEAGSGLYVPLVVTLSAGGLQSVWPVSAPQAGLISRTALSVTASGDLRIVWPLLRADGVSLLYYAVGHPA